MKTYLIISDDNNDIFKVQSNSLKDAIWEFTKYQGDASELLNKAMIGFTDEDVDELVVLVSHFSWINIKRIYSVEEEIYNKEDN